MKYAIIAAGEGSRLTQEGISVPKPLVSVGGECLIDRLIRIFSANAASDIFIITRQPLSNEDPMHLVTDHLHNIHSTVPVTCIQKATPSSMHSFYELRQFLSTDEPFILTTVDTIFCEDEFADYVTEFAASDADGLMGVTDYIDDEKPLYVATETESSSARLRITGFLDADPSHDCKYISGGIYGLKPCALDTLERCMAYGKSRMRNFQRGLIEDGRDILAFPFSKVLDIDHKSDIIKAEEFLGV